MEGTPQLVSVVGQLVGEEYRQIRGVGAQVAELSDELDTMNAILRMLSEAEEGAVDHFIRVWMNQVRELACDAEDCIDLYILRIRCRPRDRFLVWSKRLMATLFPRRRLAREIQALRARAVVISERHARYGVSREALLRCSTSPLAAPVPVLGHALGRSAVDEPNHLVGITEQAAELAERVKLVGNEKCDTKLKVFSVVGFGGLGKTTLAMEVCRQLEGDFYRQAQVSVSQAFGSKKDLEGLLKRVLEQIVKPRGDKAKAIEEEDPLGDIHQMGEVDLAAKLKKLLQDKRYLIMVDDVWTVAAWNLIRFNLPECNNGSRIIVTTRIQTVAEACSDTRVDGDCIYEIKPLELEDSKKLFLNRAFGLDYATLLADLKAEMDKILKKCGGLPMAIISIASLLASYNSWGSKEMWERVCKSIGSHMESHPTLEGMKQVVTVSFNHLHHYLKGCLMYFSIFPEDYVVVKNRLLKRWITEGLVAEVRGLTLMEVAEAYYNELVSRNMIDRAVGVASWYDRKEETCRVHDMVLEVMVSKSLEANFVSLVGGPYEGMSYGSIRRLSIHGREEVASQDSPSNKSAASHGRKNAIEGAKMQNVRSLSMFDLEDHTKVLDRLGEFTLLRVLDLEDCTSLENKHLRHVCRMFLLRFLSMKGTNINEMPPEVGNLENLETLDVRLTDLQDLPGTVSRLEKLEHLQMYNKSVNGFIARRGLKCMRALRTVNELVLGNDANVAEELGELQQLTELRIEVKTSGPYKQLVRQRLASSLSKINFLRRLNIRGGDELNFLHDIEQPPRLLQYLRIGSYITKLPDWIGSLNNLVDLVIGHTLLVDDNLFGPICELPKLKNMDLEANYWVGKELVVKAAHSFPALNDLHVNFHDPAMTVLQFEEGSMAMLEKLHVTIDDRSYKRFTGIEYLTSIKEVVFEGNKGSPSMKDVVEQLNTLNESRPKSSQIKVAVLSK